MGGEKKKRATLFCILFQGDQFPAESNEVLFHQLFLMKI